MADTQVAEKKTFNTALSVWANELTGLISRDYEACGVQFDDYAKKCAMEAMTSIYTLVKNDSKADMNSIDKSNLRQIVENCDSIKLNAGSFTDTGRQDLVQTLSKKVESSSKFWRKPEPLPLATTVPEGHPRLRFTSVNPISESSRAAQTNSSAFFVSS